MKLKLILFLSIIIISITLFAHEFWLQLDNYIVKRGEFINIKFHVGVNFTGENWKENKATVEKIMYYSPGIEARDISSIIGDVIGDSIYLPILFSGTHMLTYESKNNFINIEAEKFNAYLSEASLNNIIDYRKEHNETNFPVNQYYKYFCKVIIQCENEKFSDDCMKPTNLKLDIIPEKNIYKTTSDKSDAKKTFYLYYNKKPLANQTIRYFCKTKEGDIYETKINSDKKGAFTLALKEGQNLISTVYMEKISNDSLGNWQSYRSSLTFEYKQNLFNGGVYFIKKARKFDPNNKSHKYRY